MGQAQEKERKLSSGMLKIRSDPACPGFSLQPEVGGQYGFRLGCASASDGTNFRLQRNGTFAAPRFGAFQCLW